MTLRDKLKARKPKEITLNLDGEKVIVRGIPRSLKNQIAARCEVKGKLDNQKLEAELLAACVIDPETNAPAMPDLNDWDIPADVAGPLVAACIEVCGLDSSEYRDKLKNFEPTGS